MPSKKKTTDMPVPLTPALVELSNLPEFKKAVQAIYIACPNGSMGLLHRKAGNTLIYNAMEQSKGGDADRSFTISYKDFCEQIGYDSKDTSTIKAVLRSLRENSIEWNYLNDKGQERWGISGMLAEAELVNGIIEYTLPKKAGRLLMNPEIYARLDPTMQKRFTRSYALILYEACARYRDIKRTGALTVDQWRTILGATEDYYADFKRFNQKVLKPAIEEVNKVTDLVLHMVTLKSGRTIAQLQFLVEEKQQTTLALEGTVPFNQELYDRMMKLKGLKPETAKQIMMEKTEDYIIGNLEVVEAKLKSDKPPRAPASYFISAIRGDYRPKVYPTEKKAKTKTQSASAGAIPDKLHAAFAAHRTARTREVLAAMDSWVRDELVGKYALTITSPDLRKKYDKGGLEASSILKRGFEAWAAGQVLSEAVDTDLLAWAEKQGYLQMKDSAA